MKKADKKQEIDEAIPLVLTTVSGQPVGSFPGNVIESLRGLVTRIEKKGSFPERLSLVAARRGEGVTYTTQALAAMLANDLSAKVCIVDLNWWWPYASALVTADNLGLAAVLNGEAVLDDVIIPTGWPNLAFVPAGKLAKQDRPVLSRSQALKRLIEELGKRFDHLILDIPAVLTTNDAVPLAALGSACCLVVRQGVTEINDIQQALDEIDHLTILGVILNRVQYVSPARLTKLVSQ